MTNTSNKVVGVSFDAENLVPSVILKGAGSEAQAMLERARGLGDIPVIKSPELLHSLYRMPLDAPVGRELFPVMAALLAHVMNIDAQQQERKT